MPQPRDPNDAPARSALPALKFGWLAVLAVAAGVGWWLLGPNPGSSDGSQAAGPAGSTDSAITQSHAHETQSDTAIAPASPTVGDAPPALPPPSVDTTSQDERQAEKVVRGVSVRSEGGLIVTSVPPGSVIQQLALQPGDVILQVNGTPVSSLAEFAAIYREQGLPRQIEIQRDGRILHRH